MNQAVRQQLIEPGQDVPAVPELTQAFSRALRAAGFLGEIETSYSSRLAVATDNSIYQQVPAAVIFPRAQNDVACLMRTAAREPFRTIQFSPRGGGTGTNGQSLSPAIVVDLSRHLNRVLEINLKEGWVRVETGLVKDALNAQLAASGYFFAPDTSTSNRATIGGMIATDASGQGSLVYGKTSDHILGLRSWLPCGTRLDTEPVPVSRAVELAQGDDTLARLYRQALASCRDQRPLIETRFPPLNRFLTGYDLQHCYDPERQTIDLSRLLAGSEGTLGLVTEARLNIEPLPQSRVLVNVKYRDFQAALEHAPKLVKAAATAVETIDSKVLNLARQDIIWQQVADLLTDEPGYDMQGLNMVEFSGPDDTEVHRKVAALEQMLHCETPHQSGVIGFQVCTDQASIGRIYQMRKKAVGLLGATEGQAKPVAFVEDTAVPPESLAAFIREFRQLLDRCGLQYGMFGHVDAGVLHVRPALDLTDPDQEQLVSSLSDEVVRLVARYGGLMWGEHGKGYRSEYGPEFFGPELFAELRAIKTAFDPLNRMNPGKICTPLNSDTELVRVTDQKRAWFDRQIPIETRHDWQPPLACNGNGLCFHYDPAVPMCPSYRASGDRRWSPKGRATLLREWLRLRALRGHPEQAPTGRQDPDFARFTEEVKAALDTCLGCKACATQCPVKVDIPTWRSHFYHWYYASKRRPVRDRLVSEAEVWLPRLARWPRLNRWLTANPVSQAILRHSFGYQDLPKPPKYTLADLLAQQDLLTWDDFKGAGGAVSVDYVFLLQDPFTHSFEPQLVVDVMRLARRLGKVPVLLPYLPNGKGAHVKGLLTAFRTRARATAEWLNEIHAQYPKVPIVGIDSASALCFSDEYPNELGPEKVRFRVQLLHQWLWQTVQERSAALPEVQADTPRVAILPHCTEQSQDPQVSQYWQNIFAAFGVRAQTPQLGCCGMAGSFGHEREHQALSRQVFALSWRSTLAGLAEQGLEATATGFSCRCQTRRFSQHEAGHPIQVLLRTLATT